MTQKFGLSGIVGHVPTTVVAAALGLADAVLSWLNVLALPVWAHSLVGLLVLLLATYKGKIVSTLAGGVIIPILLCFALPAHAQTAPAFDGGSFGTDLPKLSLDLGGGYSLQTGAGFAGTVYTKTAQGVQVVRNVQMSALVEFGIPFRFLDPVVGPAWQTGSAQGWGGSIGAVEKKTGANLLALASPFVVAGKVSWAFGLGTLVRY